MLRILVDSSADYSETDAISKNIEIIRLKISFEGKEYTDGIDIERDGFYQMLETSKSFPKTSQATVWEFQQIFEDVRDKGDEMICILLSSELSGTYNSACIAKETVGYDKIYIIDSLLATIPIKMLADFAAELRDSGKTAAETADAVENMKGRIRVFACLDTLEYLAKGGRLNKTVATIGNTVHLKPIVTIGKNGRVEVIAQQIGKSKAMNTIIKMISKVKIDLRFPIYPVYTYGIENCMSFADRMANEGYKLSERLQVGPAIGTHIGPNAFGVVFVEMN